MVNVYRDFGEVVSMVGIPVIRIGIANVFLSAERIIFV
jgi:hypothetical protein